MKNLIALNNLDLLSKVMNQAINLTLPEPPQIKMVFTSVSDTLEKLFETTLVGNNDSDISLNVESQTFFLHSWIFFNWDFLTTIKTEKVKTSMPLSTFKV